MKAAAQNLGLAAATSFVFLGGLEIAARAFDRPAPAAAPWADYIWDWREKMEGDFYVIRSEAVGWPPWEEINADGLRDRTHPEQRPPGRTRLVALGDSVTLGAGIEPQEAYPQRLEALLRREGRLVDVMNVGLWGWSTRQERLAYERIVRRYRPDQVVLGVCLNDLPELQNNLARPPEWLAALFRGSALVRRLVNAPGREIQNVEQLFEQAQAPRVREAYSRFFTEVTALRDAVRQDGAGFGVAVFPFRFQVLPGAPPPVAQREIEAFCRREGIPFLDLLPALVSMGEEAFVDYDHLSPAGALRAAEALGASDLVPREPDARRILVERLGGMPDGPRAAVLVGDANAEEAARVAAAWALEEEATQGQARNPEAREGEPRAKDSRSGGLAASSKAAAIEALCRALGDPSAAVRSAAARALGAQGGAATPAEAALFERLRDDVEDVRWQAALALSKVGLAAPAAVEPLAAALRSDDPYVRGFAAWSLGNLGPSAGAAVPALVEALARDDGYGRGGAASALARLGPAAAAAVPALLEGLRSPDGDRRWKAARTLGRIGPVAREAAPALALALRDPNEHVRRHAARALGRLGPLAPEGAAALQRATGDPDGEVRKEAQEALAAGR